MDLLHKILRWVGGLTLVGVFGHFSLALFIAHFLPFLAKVFIVQYLVFGIYDIPGDVALISIYGAETYFYYIFPITLLLFLTGVAILIHEVGGWRFAKQKIRRMAG